MQSVRIVSMRAVAACVMLAAAVSGCKKPETTVNVDVHGVNYSGNEFFYSIIQPDKPGKPSGVGEHLQPFSGGGTTCCFTLPKKWQPGIKVQLWTRHWLPRLPDGTLPEVDGTATVEVPEYVDGQPGELWIVRSQEGTVSVVSSNYQPDHQKWPGKVKGWPAPSIEYQREQWEIMRKQQQIYVDTYISLLADLEKSPNEEARSAWKTAKEYRPQSLVGFSGPGDPKYLIALKKEYAEGLRRSQENLRQVMEVQP